MRHFCDIGLHPLLDYNDLTLIRVLNKKNFPDVLLKFMKSIHSKSFSNIKINQELTKLFAMQRGVLQGDPMYEGFSRATKNSQTHYSIV